LRTEYEHKNNSACGREHELHVPKPPEPGLTAASTGRLLMPFGMQVGLLRVVMSLEEKGPAVAAPAAVGASGATTPGKQQQQRPDSGQSPAAADAAARLPDQGRVLQHQSQSILQPAAAGDAAPEGAAAAGSQSFRQMPEYLVAWELEVWRKVGRQLHEKATHYLP